MRLAPALLEHPAMAILRGVHPDEVVAVAGAVADAGWRAVEVPLNRPGALQAIEALARAVPQVAVGAGTLTRADDAARVRDAGGTFAVSPHLDPALLEACARAGLDAMPGVLTPSEIFHAHRLGQTHVKIFPLEALGGRGLKALTTVSPPEVAITAVGGITADDVSDVLAHGATSVGIASWLFRPGDTAAEVADRALRLTAALERDAQPKRTSSHSTG